MNAKFPPLPLLLTLIGGASSALAAVPGYPEPTPCPDHAAWRQAAALPARRSLDDQALTPPTLANPTAETQALYLRLKQNEVLRSALFGQQHASWQAVAGNRAAFGSDVFDGLKQQVADRPNLVPAHPAIFGWNCETYRSMLLSQAAEAARLLARMIETDAKGGITTIHWPVENFVVCEGKDCDDNTNLEGVDPVDFIVTNYLAFDGQCAGDKFDRWVDDLAAFLKNLKQGDAPIPVILRPFHEMNGKGGQASHWWVGKNTAHFRTMWQRRVDRLRTQHGLRNVLVAFAPRAEAALEMGDATRAFAKDTARSVNRLVAITEVGRKDGSSNPSNGEGFLNFSQTGSS
jgi:hypothetical protein